jgi:hypothetical protein
MVRQGVNPVGVLGVSALALDVVYLEVHGIRVRVDFKKQGYLRDRRTGALIDKETGEALITTRTGVKRHGFAR